MYLKANENAVKKLYGQKEDIIVLYCDYVVLKDFAAYSQGIYPNFAAILVRENADSTWEYVDGGYA